MLPFALTLSLSLLLAAPPELPPTLRLQPAQASADVALLRRALETIHPGLDRYTPKAELDAALGALERRAAAGLTDVELYVEISRLLALIRCDHTKAELPAALETWRETNPSHLPFRFAWIEGRMFVSASDPTTNLPRGTEVLSIDGRAVGELRAALEPLVSIDGFTDFVKPRKLADDSDLLGADFDHFYPLVYGFPNELALVVRAPGATADQRRTVPLVPFAAWQRIGTSGAAYRAEFHTDTTWKMLDPKTALLRIGSFVNYRKPVAPATVYGPIFQALEGNGAEHLIIDLRDNGGGSTDAMLGLLPYLIEAPTVWNQRQEVKNIRFGDLPQYIETWGDRKALFEPPAENFRALPGGGFEVLPRPGDALFEEIAPAAERFRGRVSVLVGAANASGTTMLAAKLRDLGRVRLVGQATGGSAEGPTAGQIFFVKLPASGIKVRVPVLRSFLNIRQFQPGLGVNPDVVVPETLADFLADRDAVLAAARER